MTASDPNSADSENSVFQRPKDGVDTPANDLALVQILEYTCKRPSGTTRRDLEIRTGWNSAKISQILDRCQTNGLVEVIGEQDRQMVVLTDHGEFLARGRL